MTRLRVFLAALLLSAGLAIGIAPSPAHAASWQAACWSSRDGFAHQYGTTASNARHNCLARLDANDGCWSGWNVYWGANNSFYGKSYSKVTSWWCGFSTNPVSLNGQAWIG